MFRFRLVARSGPARACEIEKVDWTVVRDEKGFAVDFLIVERFTAATVFTFAGGEKGRDWSVRGSCALKGEGLEEGLDW